MAEMTMVPVEGRPFSGGLVPLDNMQYVRCRFENVMFVYSGGPWDFVDCQFVGACGLTLNGSANWTDLLLKRMAKEFGLLLPGSGSPGWKTN